MANIFKVFKKIKDFDDFLEYFKNISHRSDPLLFIQSTLKLLYHALHKKDTTFLFTKSFTLIQARVQLPLQLYILHLSSS